MHSILPPNCFSSQAPQFSDSTAQQGTPFDFTSSFVLLKNVHDRHVLKSSKEEDGGFEKVSKKVAADKVGKNLLAGALARASAATLMFPIDVVKTRMQFQRKLQASGNPSDVSIKTYKNAFDALKTIAKEEGVSRLYRGLLVRLIYITPSAAVSFTVYEQFMSALNNNKTENGTISWKYPLLTLAAGASARVFGTACRTPFDIVKQQLQVSGQIHQGGIKLEVTPTTIPSSISGGNHTNAKTPPSEKLSTIGGIIRNIVKNDGIKGFWSGYGVTLLRDAPFASIYFTSYEAMKKLQRHFINGKSTLDHNRKVGDGENQKGEYVGKTKAIQHFVAGASAGAIATCCTIPIDVVKTRLQTQTNLGTRHYNGVLHAFKRIYQEEGWIAFTKGLGPRLTYIMPAAALTFTIYEQIKDFVK